MSSFRASSTMALPPSAYGKPKGRVYQGVDELDRFPPKYDTQEDVFEDYMANKSMSPSRHTATLGKSGGLMELHYNTMRKKAIERAAWPTAKELPGMDRAFTAIAGYSGFIPSKVSSNICGCSHKTGSQIAYETSGKFFDPPMSGTMYTLGVKSPSRSCSLPQLASTSSGFR